MIISYDNYLNRIQKIAKFKNFVHKFRFLIAGIFALIIAGTTGLLIAKGTVTTAMTLPAQIIYGEDYSPTPASAFLSSVSYEYRLEEGGEWSSKKPIKAGKYIARTVTQKTIGKGYGNPVHFEIVPLDVNFTIGSTSVVYGGVPANCKISKTVYGQRLAENLLVFEYESYTAKKTNVFVDQNSVKITDSTGEDYTSCYNINFESVSGGVELEILPRTISLQADSVTQTYSGNGITVANEVSANSKAQLVNGDKITVQNGVFDYRGEEVFAPKNSGTYSIRVKSYTIMHGTDDVTHQYNVNTLNALLTINAREITITTGGGEKVYDGTALKNATFTHSGLIEGHRITEQGEYLSITDAGTIENINSYLIYDGNGEDVTSNYTIKSVFGKLIVNKRAITVKTGDANREYDGLELFNHGYELLSGSIVEGQSVTTNEYSIRNVRQSGDNMLLLTIFDGFNNVTYNYDITYVFGKLTLTPRNITIKTDGDEREYNTFPLSNDGHTISQGSLVSGHREVSTNFVYITDAGSIENALKFRIYDNNGYGEEVTDNYNIAYDYGTLTVTPRPIVVITGSRTDFIFNGEWRHYEGYDTAYAKDERTKGLLYSDTLTVSGYSEIMDVGESLNELTFTENRNYEITRTDYGTLKVLPRPITVVTASEEWTYDGKAHSNSTFMTHYYGNINDFGLLKSDSDKLRLTGVASIVGAGSIANSCEGYELSSDNYEVKEISYGTLTIQKRTMAIVLADMTLKYGDIIEYPYAGSYTSAQGLVEGENLEVFVKFVGFEAGKINRIGNYIINLDEDNTKITDKNGEDSKGNYTIICSEAALTVESRRIIVTTGDADKEYDGEALYSEEITILGYIVEGQRYEIAFRREITDVDETFDGNNDSTVDIFDEHGGRVTDNYEIVYEKGTLTVTPRLIYYTTPSQEWVYDATEHSSYENYTTAHFPLGDKGLIFDNEELILISFATIKDAGEKDNECIFGVPNSNYYIVGEWCFYGKLAVTARPITIETPSDQWDYNGKEHFNWQDYKTYYGSAQGLLNGDELTVVSYAKITYVGDGSGIQNKCEYKVPNTNYAIVANGYIYGTLKITPRPIVVVTDSAEKEYDGTPLSCITYTTYYLNDRNQVGLIEGDGLLNPTYITYRTNAGSEDNVCKFDVPSNNYVIEGYEYGTLTITPHKVTVVISEIEHVTYGETFKYPSHRGNYESAEGLAEGEILRIAVYYMQNGERIVPKNAGKYEVVLDIENTLVYDIDREEIEGGMSNYVLSAENITAEILKKNINFTTLGAEIIYGEGEDFETKYTFDIAPEDMPYGEEIRLSFKYYLDDHYYDSPYHVGEYEIRWWESEEEGTIVYQDGVEVVNGKYNYQIYMRPVWAKVTVNPKEITVELLDVLSVYGDAFEYPSYTGNYKNSGTLDLPYGDTITVFVKQIEELPTVGIHYGYVQADEEKTLVNGVADTSDYTITYVNGDLEVIKRSIIVINLGAQKVYDGTPLTNGEYTTRTVGSSTEGLLGDDTLTLMGELVSITSVSESGTPNANRYENPENYEIAGYEDGELIITPKSITVEINEVEDVTYGESFNYPTGRGNFKNVERCGLAEGEELEIAVIYYKLGYLDDVPEVIGWYEEDGTPIEQPKNAGNYKVALDIQRTKIYKGGDELEDGLSNYVIDVVTTTAAINRKVLWLAFEPAEITYGEGEDFVPEYSFDVAPEDMPYGEEIRFIFRYRYLWFVNAYNDIVEVTYFPKHAGTYDIYWRSGAAVYQGDDEIEDGVYNYQIYLSTDEPKVTVKPKEITVELLDIEGIEYGEGYWYPEYEGNYKNRDTLDLPYGDILTLFDSGTRNDEVLSVGIHYLCVYVDETKTLVNGVADTSDYKITYISGNLEIVQRQILVTNLGAEKVYDGVALTSGEYTTRSANDPLKAGLLYGDKLELIGEPVSITLVSESGTYNANRYDVSDNYSIVGYKDEQLVIRQRKIVIASASGEWEYDGEYHSLDSFNEDESYYYNESTGEKEPALVLDHYFVALTSAKIKDVGSIRNVSLGENEIYDGEGNPVTENYDIDVENSGYLTITPRHIVVRTHSDTKPYDGTPLICEDYSTYYYQGKGAEYTDESEKGLVVDDELVLVNEWPIYATYVWEYKVVNINNYESPVGEYDEANYVIEFYIYGYLEITPREITVEIDNIVKEYDCGAYIIGVDDYSVDNLADGELLEIAVMFTTEEGVYISSDEKFNVGIYNILLSLGDCVIYRDGEIFERGMENYTVYGNSATLTITPRKLTIIINDIEAVYGDEIVYNGYQGGEDIPYFHGVQEELVFDYYFANADGEKISGKIRVGNYFVCADEDSVRITNGSLDNYEIEFLAGLLTITPKAVDIVLKDQTVTYGDEFVYPDGTDSYYPVELPYGDTLEVFIKALADERLNADTYFDYIAADEELTLVNGESDTSDYIFNYISGALTVEKRGITLKLIAPERNYVYGEIYSYPMGIGNYESAENLAYGEQLEVAIVYFKDGEIFHEPKNRGTYKINLNYIVIYDEFGSYISDGNKNYDVENIGEVPVELTVEWLWISVELHDSEYIYGFEAPEITFSVLDYYTREEIELPFGDVMTFEYRYNSKDGNGHGLEVAEDAGVYDILSGTALTYINGEPLSTHMNYNMNVVRSTLTIHKRQIAVETATSSHEYDGNPYSDATVYSYFYDESDPENREIAGFVNGYLPEIDLESVPTVTSVAEGRVKNEFTFTVSDNYEIVGEITYGEIWITARGLTVELYDDLTIIYGEEFSYPAGVGNYKSQTGLVEGDELEVYAILVAAKEVPDIGTYEIAGVKELTLINGGDSSDYEITFISGQLVIKAREIYITSAPEVIEYDGEYHSPSSNIDEGNSYHVNKDGEIEPALIFGHRFEVIARDEIKDVGTIPNGSLKNNRIFDENGNDVTDNYAIAAENLGTLTIVPRKIKVITVDQTKPYDGEELVGEYTVTHAYDAGKDGFVGGDEAYITVTRVSIVNVWQSGIANKPKFVFPEGENGANYVIVDELCEYGELEITKLGVSIEIGDKEKDYDGRIYELKEGEKVYEDGFVQGESLHIVVRFENIDGTPVEKFNIGEYKILLDLNGCTLYKDGDEFKRGMENYDISCDGSILTVNKREVIVYIDDASVIYGNTIGQIGFTTKDPVPTFVQGTEELSFTYHFEDADNQTVSGRLNVGLYSICYDEGSAAITGGSIDNYEITVINGTLEITTRYLIIETQGAEKVYDTTALSNEVAKVLLSDGVTAGLLEGDSITYSNWAFIIEVGEIDNSCDLELPNDNYGIELIRFGKLKVTEAELIIVLNDVPEVNYGERLSYPTVDGKTYESVEGLFEGETLEVAVYYTNGDGIVTPRNAGEYTVNIDLENSRITGTVNGLGNYFVTCETKTAIINRLHITLALQDVEYEYDSTAHGYEQSDYTIVEGNTVYGEFFNVFVTYYNGDTMLGYAPRNAGEYKIKLDIENCLVNGGYMNANLNYVLECEEEFYNYTITQAKFSVTVGDLEVVYTGNVVKYTALSGGFTVEGLKGTDEIECNVKYFRDGVETEPKNAGEYQVVFDTDNIIFSQGDASNYVFDDTDGNYTGTLTIFKRTIRVTVTDREIEYEVEVRPEDESYTAVLTDEGYAIYGVPAFVSAEEEAAAGARFSYRDGRGNSTEGPFEVGGLYYITVRFSNTAITDNYEIEIIDAILTVTGRKVLLTPVYDGGILTYSGYDIDVEELKRQGLLYPSHVHNIDNAAEDDRYGFKPEDFEKLTFIYEFENATTGDSYRDGAAPKDAGNYYIYIRILGEVGDKYVVSTERRIDFLIINPAIIEVTHISSEEKEYDRQGPRDIVIEYSGFVGEDDKICSIAPEYFDKSTGTRATYFNAGSYEISAKVEGGNGANNYRIVYRCEKGTLTITPITLYIRPIDKAEYYQGYNLALLPGDYKFVDKENGKYTNLLAGDVISIGGSTVLEPTRTNVTVTIAKATVRDTLRGVDTSENYILKYTYEKAMGTLYSSSDFKGTLEFKLRNVYYKTIIPSGQKTYPYDGEVRTIEDATFEIVSGKGEGLYANDRLMIRSATVGPQVGTYYNWLNLYVWDRANGRDVSRVYNLVLENEDESAITIEVIEVTIQIHDLSVDMLERGSDVFGDVFYTASLFDSRNALATRFYTVNGIKTEELNHKCEIIAIKSKGVWHLAVVIYEPKASGSLTDRSESYRITFVKDETLNVVCDVVECHSLTIIQSDITLKVTLGYSELLAGEGMTIYENRPALTDNQYEVVGLLSGHEVSQVVVFNSRGKLTFAVLVTNGRSDRSYYYNLLYELPSDYPTDKVTAVLASRVTDVPQDVTISIDASLDSILAGEGLKPTYDGRLELDGGYSVEGLLPGHSVQVIPVMSGGKVTLEVLIFEAKMSNGTMSGRSDRSYYYNLLVENAPAGAAVMLATSPDDVVADVKITLDKVTVANLASGVGIVKSTVDQRNILDSSMFTIEEYFGARALASNHYVEIVVEKNGDGFNLFVVVYQLTSSGKRSDRSYLYDVKCVNVQDGITAEYINTADLGNLGKN